MSQPRKATLPELAAAVFLLVAALVLTGTVLLHRVANRSAPVKSTATPELNGSMIVPTEAAEGVTYTDGPDLLFVDTVPEGAQATLDGQPLGATPYSSNLSCRGGGARLEVKKPGYQTVSLQLECGKGTTRVSLALKRGKP